MNCSLYLRSHFRGSRRGFATRPKSKWKSVVGLEVHAQINSNSKLFSASSTTFGAPVNSNVSLFDAAYPGTLPVLNRNCVEKAVLTSLALSCELNPVSWFDRKHYFYADLPAGYQITQQRFPLASNGRITFDVVVPGTGSKPYVKTSTIKQLQLEQDSGKSIHDENGGRSLIDLNRAGVPLMELVFEPDLVDGEEAAALVKELTLVLGSIGTCSCRMEEGALRVDANVSIHEPGKPFGTRTEIKNIGSVRGVANAVDFEIRRQVKAKERGEVIVNETRAWDPNSGETVPMRDKEITQDYRFMPEPNLPPLRLDSTLVDRLSSSLPELPEQTRLRLKSRGLSRDFITILINEPILLSLFDSVIHDNPKRDVKTVAKVLTIELMTLVNKGDAYLSDGKFNRTNLGELSDLLESKSINLVSLRSVMAEVAQGVSTSPRLIVENLGLGLISDEKALEAICRDVVESNPDLVKKYRSGQKKLMSAMLGLAAKKTGNRANMEKVAVMLNKMLNE